MTAPSIEREAGRFADALAARLDAVAAAGRRVAVWWRDDDAVAATPALDRLLALAARHRVPIALAVIPAPAEPSLARRLTDAPEALVLQHGFAHANHQPAGDRKAELGDARPVEVVLAELADGRRRLEDLVGTRLLPVLTPPWNRVAPAVATRRGEVGLPGLSTLGERRAAPLRLDTHLDPIAWRTTRGFHGFARMLALLDEEIAARAPLADPAPIGLLTHHLVHDAGVWAFAEAFVAVTAAHPAAEWPALDAAFGLARHAA